MKRILLGAITLSLLGFGCRAPVMAPRVTTEAAPTLATKVALGEHALARADEAMSLRAPGDYVIYRFSGSYRDTPVTLTQRVVAHRDDLLVVDVTVDERGSQHRLRLRMRQDGELISVAKLEGTIIRPFGRMAYEQLMNELMLVADENDGLITESESVQDVAGRTLAVTTSAYKVRVGAHDAVMKTVAAPGFVWGDVGGEIKALDGKILYKAEIVELGSDRESMAAAYDETDLYEGYDHFEE